MVNQELVNRLRIILVDTSDDTYNTKPLLAGVRQMGSTLDNPLRLEKNIQIL
ncbi:MAG: hypothetical protein ACI8Y9_001678 [Paracoccaceae bacterium]|jgi:hypothetical protein